MNMKKDPCVGKYGYGQSTEPTNNKKPSVWVAVIRLHTDTRWVKNKKAPESNAAKESLRQLNCRITLYVLIIVMEKATTGADFSGRLCQQAAAMMMMMTERGPHKKEAHGEKKIGEGMSPVSDVSYTVHCYYYLMRLEE